MTHATRWGILAPGGIAHGFAKDLALVPGAELVAVGSRSHDRAAAFAAQYGAAAAYGTYEELVADPAVDVVYIASPHAVHLEHALMCFEAGKHVLCEKPVTLSTPAAEAMVEAAGRQGRFLMEAMWTACHPVILETRRRLLDGDFGTPRHLHAELGFLVTDDPSGRMLNPELGASVLLDMGVYPLTVAHLFLGEAVSLTALGELSDGGIDLDVAIAGRYPSGVLATMSLSMTSYSSRVLEVATDRGRVVLGDGFHHPRNATFTPYAGRDGTPPGDEVRIQAAPIVGNGYAHEAIEVQRCLAAGLLESPLVPHSQTLAIMRQMDDLRAQMGVSFPEGR